MPRAAPCGTLAWIQGCSARQFLGWLPASSWVGRPPVVGLVAHFTLLVIQATRTLRCCPRRPLERPTALCCLLPHPCPLLSAPCPLLPAACPPTACCLLPLKSLIILMLPMHSCSELAWCLPNLDSGFWVSMNAPWRRTPENGNLETHAKTGAVNLQIQALGTTSASRGDLMGSCVAG